MKCLNIDFDKHDEIKYFKDVCLSQTLGMTTDNCLTDGNFFKYFRSIVFAHPFETNRSKFLKKRDEIHYSPYLMTEHNNIRNCDNIGIMIYSNKTSSPKPLYIPHTSIFNYINTKYKLFHLVNQELKKRIENKNKEWMKYKVNRKQSPEKILQEISNILNDRYEDTYEIDALIDIIKYESKNIKNNASVQKVKKIIISFVSQICDCIDELNYENLGEITSYILYDRPNHMYQGATYDLEKIFTYLNNDISYVNQTWGEQCADKFSKQFASKWVDINVNNMNYEEIRLLTIVACCLEKEEEKFSQNVRTSCFL